IQPYASPTGVVENIDRVRLKYGLCVIIPKREEDITRPYTNTALQIESTIELFLDQGCIHYGIIYPDPCGEKWHQKTDDSARHASPQDTFRIRPSAYGLQVPQKCANRTWADTLSTLETSFR